jgi:hypothetical protein
MTEILPKYHAEARRSFVPQYDKDGKQIGSLPIKHRYLFIQNKWGEEYRILIYTRKDQTTYSLSKKRLPKTSMFDFLTVKEKLQEDRLLKKSPWIKSESMDYDRLMQMLRIWLGDQADKAYQELLEAVPHKKEKKKK